MIVQMVEIKYKPNKKEMRMKGITVLVIMVLVASIMCVGCKKSVGTKKIADTNVVTKVADTNVAIKAVKAGDKK